jgi:phage baseplate assembly protein W
MESFNQNRDFLGQGLAFPLQINAKGGLALAIGENDILQAINIILRTMPGERVMRPEFGCRIQELVFAPRTTETYNLIVIYVTEALNRWEPRITVQHVDVNDSEDNPGGVFIEISYVVNDTYNERSIVYPFYLSGDEEAPV